VTFKYEPRHAWAPKVDPKRCPACLIKNYQTYQCSRPRGEGPEGWCKQHDPENVKKRGDERYEKWKQRAAEKSRRETESALSRATIEQLKAELKRRKRK